MTSRLDSDNEILQDLIISLMKFIEAVNVSDYGLLWCAIMRRVMYSVKPRWSTEASWWAPQEIQRLEDSNCSSWYSQFISVDNSTAVYKVFVRENHYKDAWRALLVKGRPCQIISAHARKHHTLHPKVYTTYPLLSLAASKRDGHLQAYLL